MGWASCQNRERLDGKVVLARGHWLRGLISLGDVEGPLECLFSVPWRTVVGMAGTFGS